MSLPRSASGASEWCRAAAAIVLVLLLSPRLSLARERYALVVVGAAGSEAHAQSFKGWSDALVSGLTATARIPRDRVKVLGGRGATRDEVISALGALAQRVTPDDLLLIVLLGHGTYDGIDAKFNLAGPDLEAAQWKALLAPVDCTLVFVNTASASAPFLAALAGERRVVITATDSPAQRFDTVFPRFFVAAFDDAEADLDKDRRLSVGEAFTYAATRARRWYEQRGQLPTERAVLDDNGDGTGQEAGVAGPDGAVASRVYLDPGPEVALTSDPAMSELLGRRDRLEADIEALKRTKAFMPAADYDRELERLLVALARLSRQIRARS